MHRSGVLCTAVSKRYQMRPCDGRGTHTCCNGCICSLCEDLPPGTRTFWQTCVTLQHILCWFLDCFFSCPLFPFGLSPSKLSHLCSHLHTKTVLSHMRWLHCYLCYILGRRITCSPLWLVSAFYWWERDERFAKEIGKGGKKAWRVEWQVISPSTADQVPLSVELHSMFQAHLSISLPFFSFSIFPSIFWYFLQHIAGSVVTSFFRALFIFCIHYFFFVPVLSSWCLL